MKTRVYKYTLTDRTDRRKVSVRFIWDSRDLAELAHRLQGIHTSKELTEVKLSSPEEARRYYVEQENIKLRKIASIREADIPISAVAHESKRIDENWFSKLCRETP